MKAAVLALLLTLTTTGCLRSQSRDADGEPYSLLVNASPHVEWVSFPDGLRRASESGKKLLVDIFSPNCGWCTRMQKEAYSTESVVDYVTAHFVTARLDIDVLYDTVAYKNVEVSSGQLAYGLGARGTPTTVFMTSGGEYITRLPGYRAPDEYLQVLRFIATDAYREMSFDEWRKAAEGD